MSISRLAVVLISTFSLALPAGAARVTSEQAMRAARNWLRRGYGFERRMGTDIETVRSLAGTNGAVFHIAAVKGGGFVVLGSDTEDSPVVAVSAQGRGEPDVRSPLWALLRQDMTARMLAKAEKRRALHAAAGTGGAAGSSPEERWARLLEQDEEDDQSSTRRRLLSESDGRTTVADVRVDALLQSAWSQEDYRNYGYTTADDICYNYYTPNHWPCGCVATAGAQVMRYHSYPTSAVVAGTYACSKGGSPVNLTMYGGAYNWDAMTLVPANGCSATSREAIGRLTYDVGVTVGMAYGSGGSSSPDYMLSKRFVDRFLYANAVSVVFQNGFFRGGDCSYTLARFKSAVIPNFDAGLPVVLGISGSGGHAVVGDGYGYSDGDFFVHINLGWANMDNGNVWYVPPDIERYTSIDSIVYNVYPTGASGASIVSGRILSTEGLPVEGALVKIVADGAAASVAASSSSGTYALKVSPGTYWVVAEKDGQSASNRVTVSACVSPHLAEDGSYYDDICPQVGNVCDSDLTLDAAGTPEPPPPENLTWQTTKAEAFAAAEAGGKRILLVYGRDTCGNTTATRNYTCEDAEVKAKLLADYVLWYSDCDTQSAESGKYLMNFEGTLPGVSVIDPALDAAIAGAGGYQSVSAMLALLEAAENWEAPSPSVASELTEARIRAHDSGKLLFFLNGQACDGNTQFVMDYLNCLGSDFSDSFELYFCDIGSDTTGMAVYAWPVYAVFDPLKFKANWEDGLLAEDMESGAVAEAVQKVLDDALDEYARQMSPDSSDRHLVCYELDGGTNAKSNPASYKADELPLPLVEPSRDSHVFLGWEKDGESVVEIAKGTTGHVVLVAKWRPATADDCVWSYVVENGEAKIYAGWYKPAVTPMPTGDVVIPSELGGCPVTEIGDTAFAFGEMSRLTIPASVRKIGSMVFDRCPNLEIVVDPGNAYFSSEDGVLYNKDKTVLICCPSGKNAVSIPSTVIELGEHAFDCCEKIEVIDLPRGLKKIGAFAFSECRSLRELILPEGLESIGARSMGNYYGRITELHIPASVTNIDENAWGESIAIVKVTVAGGNPRYEMSDGILYDKSENRVLFCERNKTQVSLREGTAAVDSYAFYFCLDLTELTLPSTLARVGYAAFWGCSFADVTIPASLVSIEGDAFSYCDGLKDVYFDGDEPEHVGQWIFRGTSEDLKVHVREGAVGWLAPGQSGDVLRWPARDAYSRQLVFRTDLPPVDDEVSVSLSVSGIGWHEVSFPVLPDGGDPADVFAPVEDQIGYVTYGSKNWNPLTGGTLMALEIGKGYWVQTTAASVTWTVTGQGDPGVEIALKAGWNLIGYPLLEAGEVETALATALATGKIDWISSGSRVYPGTLTTLAPGKGYWVYANAAVTIKFD